MAYTNGYGYGYGTGSNTYREIGVKTASQGKLVVMLYEAAVSNLEKAIALVDADNKIQAKNVESFGNFIQKVSDIVTELQISLDMEKGGDIAKNLMSLYIFFNKTLLDCSLTHDREALSAVLKNLSDLRDSWVIAANSTANTQVDMPQNRASLNITG